MDLKDMTAAELARCIDETTDFPQNTGALSMLDEATLAFGSKYPKIGDAQRALADARHRHMRSYSPTTRQYSDDAWNDAMTSAKRLASELRALGNVRIARCKRRAGWGTCNLPLGDDGQCHSSLGHVDD
jgi:hypothetical protein